MRHTSATSFAPACRALARAHAAARRFRWLKVWAVTAPLLVLFSSLLAAAGSDAMLRPLLVFIVAAGALAGGRALCLPTMASMRLRIGGLGLPLLYRAARWFDATHGSTARHVAIDAVHALALSTTPATDPIAHALAASHATACDRALSDALTHNTKPSPRAAAAHSKWAQTVGVLVAGLWCLCATIPFVAPDAASALRCAWSQTLSVRWANAPLSSDWQARVKPPAYQRRAPHPSRGTTSDVSAYAGSVIEAQGTLDGSPPWAEVWLFAHEAAFLARRPLLRIPAVIAGNHGVQATMPASVDVLWSLVVGVDARHALLERQARHIHIESDKAPIAVLDAPGPEQAWPARGNLPIRWHAQDDFGLVRATLCTRSQPDDLAPPLCVLAPITQANAAETTTAAGQLDLSLESFRDAVRQAGGELDVALQLSVVDNDTWRGPNVGTSSPVIVTLYDPRAIRAWSLEAARQGLQALVTWLADEWAPEEPSAEWHSPAHAARIAESIEFAWRQLRHAYDLLEQDEDALAIERHAIDEALVLCEWATKQRSSLFADAWVTSRHKRLTALILSLDRLFSTRRLGEAGAHKEDAIEAIARLQQALASSSADEQVLNAALSSVKDRLTQYAQALAQKQEHLAQAPGVADSEQHSSFADALARIEQAIAQGDTHAAAQELQALQARLDSMQEAATESSEQARDPLDADVQRALQALASATEQALSSERSVLATLNAQRSSSSASPSKALRQAHNEWQSAMLAAGEQLDHLHAQKRFGPFVQAERDVLSRLLNDMRTLGASGLWRESLQRTQRAIAASQELKERWSDGTLNAMLGDSANDARQAKATLAALPLAFQRVKNALETRSRAQQAQQHQQGRDALQALRPSQQGASQQIEELTRSLRALHDQQPLLPEHHPRLDDAAQRAAHATQALAAGDGDASTQSLADAVASLEAFLEDLAGQQKDSAQAGGQPAPMPGTSPGRQPGGTSPGERRSGDDPGTGGPPGSKRQAKRRGRQGNDGQQGQQGGTGQPSRDDGPGRKADEGEKVDIPGFDARRDPSAYRQRVQEAAQQPAPAPYKQAVRDYYEDLLR